MTFLSRPLFWLLEFRHKLFSNWGMAIIAITFLLKLVFYPLSEASRPLDGEDEADGAAHEAAAGNLQGRSRQARPGA